MLSHVWTIFLHLATFNGRGGSEEVVVEFHHIALRAVVGVESGDVDGFVGIGKFARDIVEQSPVARSPSVYALLHVAHDEVG